MASETALELDVDAAGYTRSEGVHFGGFPGVWEPGRPVAVSELGFDTEEEALALVDELELPLRPVQVDAGSARMPERPNHLLSQEQQRVLANEAAANWPPRSHKDADAVAAAASIEWPRPKMTLDEKVAQLESVLRVDLPEAETGSGGGAEEAAG
jgi:hypothetical protein